MDLTIIKPKKYKVETQHDIYNLKFTLESFAFLEERLDSVENALELFNSSDIKVIPIFFEAGLVHTKCSHNILKMLENVDLYGLASVISKVLNDTLTSEFDFDKKFDWPRLYFIAKFILNLSEEEFWNSTPKKILTMMKMFEKEKKDNNMKNYKKAIRTNTLKSSACE